MKNKNVFVIGLDPFNLEKLRSIQGASNYTFHKLLDMDEVRQDENIPVAEKLLKAQKILDEFDGTVDAIVGYWDFPVSTMLPILCEKYGLLGASLESVLKCEHKYWSRLEQQKVIPEYTPKFYSFDPFDPDALDKIHLEFPFWIKPVKSFKSYLGFKINNEQDFNEAIQEIRDGINRIAEPFTFLLDHISLPEPIAGQKGSTCIAEQLIGGRQCTLEGYNANGTTRIYGIVDSIREVNHSSFARYQYPSALPDPIKKEMESIGTRFIDYIGYRDAPFNVEFFYDEIEDKIWFLEVNTRISKSHCPLFEKVEGSSHQEVMVKVALGEKIKYPSKKGNFKVAAKFMVRAFEDAIVLDLPDETRIREIEKEIPGTTIHLLVQPGMHLTDLQDQDSYSFEIAEIYMGAQDEHELELNYQKCLEELGFDFAHVKSPERLSSTENETS